MALKPNYPTIYPTLRCRDARATIKFLTDAFGLTEHSVTAPTARSGMPSWPGAPD